VRLGRRRDGGAAAVETALVLPILLLIVFGIIDFGRMLNAQISLTEAAREGARAESLGASVETRVDTATTGLGGTATVEIDWDESQQCPSSPDPEDDAVIILTYEFDFITPVGALAGIFAGQGFGGPLTITGEGVMPCRA
jgi:hypothetical protein